MFSRYKNIHKDGVGILFAPGPSLKKFNYDFISDDSFIQVGINSVIYNDNINLDYYFSSHEKSRKKVRERQRLAAQYKDGVVLNPVEVAYNKQVKNIFCCTTVNGSSHPQHLNDDEIKGFGVIPYDVISKPGFKNFKSDISKHSFYNQSNSFPAIQFLLYTGVKKIYLVGHDCGAGSSYLSPNERSIYDVFLAGEKVRKKANLVPHWKICKEFIDINYPDVDIVSVNPVNLKGIFNDVYYIDDLTFPRVNITHAENILKIRNHKTVRPFLHNSEIFSMNDFVKWFNLQSPEWYMILWNDIAVGYIRTSMEDNMPYVGIDIHPDYRRKGYAKAGYEKIFSIMKSRGHEKIGLAVLEDNIPAITLYKKLGFDEISRSDINKKPSIIMIKKL